MAHILFCVFLIAFSLRAMADDASGLKVSAAVDLTGQYKAKPDSSADDSWLVREAEIMLSAPIDQTFDGMLSFASHREEGEAFAEIHEAYIKSSKLIPRSNLKAGQFFLGVGRLNRFHRHEWPFIFAPKVHHEFFGEEGALDSGFEYSYLAPLPFFLETTLGLTNGWTYGHAHDAGEKPKQATHYGRLASFAELPGQGGAEYALNFLSRTNAQDERMTLLGLDLTARWRQAGLLQWLLQGEAWHRSVKPLGARAEDTFGAYFLSQYALDSQWFAGLLVDYYSVLSLKDVLGKSISNNYQAITPTLSYKASEFSTLRAAYHASRSTREDRASQADQRIELQATFLIGAHPAHDF